MARKQSETKKASPAPAAPASPATIDVLLSEKRSFAPPKAFTAKANAKSSAVYAKGSRNPEAYWADWAKQLTGTSRGRRSSTGSRRTRSGSSAAS